MANLSNLADGLEVLIGEILERKSEAQPLNDMRRNYMREFSEDLLLKTKHAIKHRNRLKRELLKYKFSKFVPFLNGSLKEGITDAYAGVANAIKGISDNLNSLILSLYVDHETLMKYDSQFEGDPTRARQIHPKELDKLERKEPSRIPQISEGVSLVDYLNGNHDLNQPFIDFHRNLTAHSKTGQYLSFEEGAVHVNEPTQGGEVDNSELLERIDRALYAYLRTSIGALRKVAESDPEVLALRKPNQKKKNRLKLSRKISRRYLQKGLTAAGLTAALLAPLGLVAHNKLMAEQELAHRREISITTNPSLTGIYGTRNNILREDYSVVPTTDEEVRDILSPYIHYLFQGEERNKYIARLREISSKLDQSILDSIQEDVSARLESLLERDPKDHRGIQTYTQK